ncbi:hypothetical protein ACFX2A_013291 [Malus domestica]
MWELHKKYLSNDLYSLPKACQESLDLALTRPNTKQIIQKWFDLGMKARFQHIHETNVLDFNMDLYTDMDPANYYFLEMICNICDIILRFSLSCHYYLDTQDACITHQELTHKALETQDHVTALLETIARVKGETITPDTPGEHALSLSHVAVNGAVGVTKDQYTLPNDPEDEDRNLIGPSALNSMQISMVHVLSVEFQPTTSQPSFLDGDVVAEETTQVDFVAIK